MNGWKKQKEIFWWRFKSCAAGNNASATPLAFIASRPLKNISRRVWQKRDCPIQKPTTFQHYCNYCAGRTIMEIVRTAAKSLTEYAVSFRYPGENATLPEAKIALKHCRSLRAEARRSLGLKK